MGCGTIHSASCGGITGVSKVESENYFKTILFRYIIKNAERAKKPRKNKRYVLI
jgi:hypothetical protein